MESSNNKKIAHDINIMTSTKNLTFNNGYLAQKEIHFQLLFRYSGKQRTPIIPCE